MNKIILLLIAVLACAGIFGCAAKQEYFIKEAETIKADALEPVIFRSDRLVTSLRKIKPRFAEEKSEIDELMTEIKSEIEKTKRFKHVVVLKKEDVSSEAEGFLIYPEVHYMTMDIRATYDPQRKRYIASGSACFKIYDAYDASKEIATFTSKHHFEKMGKSGQAFTINEQNEQKRALLRLIFVDLAIQLGSKFNPSYVMGTIEKISGKTAHVYIKTDRLRDLKTKQQQIAVIDDDNKPLATIEPISIEDGSLTGIFNAKTNETIKAGMKVRARIYKAKD
jgi:uncharacterized protein (UPF0335 family)